MDTGLAIHNLYRIEGRQEFIGQGLTRHVDALHGMREDEAVDAYHDRYRQLFRDPERQDV